MSGKGQFVCGNLKCQANDSLTAWEVPFAYIESEEKKVALVKLKLCADCSYKLNYRSMKDNKRKRVEQEDVATNNITDDRVDNNEDTASKDESAAWTAPVKMATEKEEDEDFDAYLNDIFS